MCDRNRQHPYTYLILKKLSIAIQTSVTFDGLSFQIAVVTMRDFFFFEACTFVNVKAAIMDLYIFFIIIDIGCCTVFDLMDSPLAFK